MTPPAGLSNVQLRMLALLSTNEATMRGERTFPLPHVYSFRQAGVAAKEISSDMVARLVDHGFVKGAPLTPGNYDVLDYTITSKATAALEKFAADVKAARHETATS